MHKLLHLWIFLLGLAFSARGQNAALACGNGRYVDDVFPGAPTVSSDVVFGNNFSLNYATGKTTAVTLRLDVYEPAGDEAAQRPLVILAFGGAFIQGSRKDDDVVAICQAFARKGYVAAAIDYRLIESDLDNYSAVYTDQTRLTDEVIRAVADMKAAVRFFKRDAAIARTYRIDPTKIFVGGFSAGAITALEVAYTNSATDNPVTAPAYADNGGLEGNTDLAASPLLPTYNATGIAGVINIAGAVNSLSMLDAQDPPLYSAQGDADQLVPYGCGKLQLPPPLLPTTFDLCGGRELAARASTLGLTNQLHTVVNGNHSSPVNEPTRSQIIAEAATFLQPLVCATPLPVTLTAFTGRVAPEDCTATLAWQTASERQSYAYEVQGSADGQAFAALGMVPSKNRSAGATYAYRIGALADKRYFRLRMLDIDGSAAYSPIVTLTATCGPAQLLLTPNPTRNRVVVTGLPTGRSRLLLYNVTGQCVVQTSTEGPATLDLGGLPTGVYLLKVVGQNGATVGSTRVVKE